MAISRFVLRLWYYFRMGYSIYLTFILGIATTLVTVYFLYLANLSFLRILFPSFEIFAVIAVILGVPVSVLLGWLHMKRTHAWAAEVDIGIEANPYVYKLQPGKEQEAFAPTYLMTLVLLRKLAEKQGVLTPEETKEVERVEANLRKALSGAYLGTPRRKI